MRPATAEAPANIALIKYWGARDLDSALPANPSISMTLSSCLSRCTCEPLDGAEDRVEFRGADGRLAPADEAFAARVRRHLDRLRARTGAGVRCRIRTENTFPAGAGMASSASGFCALALAFGAAVEGRPTPPRELSIRARLSGSGSATRSALGGYVEWPGDEGDADCPARALFDAEHWDLRDVVAVVQTEPKSVSSLDGHRRAATSPYFERRLAELPARLDAVREALAARDFAALAPTVEEEAIDLHLIALSSRPPVFYWKPSTLAVLERVRRLRDEGVDAAATMDAGANVHVLCTAASEEAVAAALVRVEGVSRVLRDRVGAGPRLVEDEVA